MTIAEMSRRVKAFNIVEETEDILVEHTEEIILMNQNQLMEGKGLNDEDLPEYKDYRIESGERYEDVKARMNPKNGGRYDMRYTGASFSTMDLEIVGGSFRLTSQGYMQNYDDGTNDKGDDVKGNILGVPFKQKRNLVKEIIQRGLVQRLSEKLIG